MSDAHYLHNLSERIARVEERMETMNERYDKGWSLPREDIAKRDANLFKWIIGLLGMTVLLVGVGSFGEFALELLDRIGASSN